MGGRTVRRGDRERDRAAVGAELHAVRELREPGGHRLGRDERRTPQVFADERAFRLRDRREPIAEVLLGDGEVVALHSHDAGAHVLDLDEAFRERRVRQVPPRLVERVADLVDAVFEPAHVVARLVAPRFLAKLLEPVGGAAGSRRRADVDELRVLVRRVRRGRVQGLRLRFGQQLRLVVDDHVEAVAERRGVGSRREAEHAAVGELVALLRGLRFRVGDAPVYRAVSVGVAHALPENLAEPREHLARGRVVVVRPKDRIAHFEHEERGPYDRVVRLARLARHGQPTPAVHPFAAGVQPRPVAQRRLLPIADPVPDELREVDDLVEEVGAAPRRRDVPTGQASSPRFWPRSSRGRCRRGRLHFRPPICLAPRWSRGTRGTAPRPPAAARR